jgi:hypothetical protein
MLMAQVNLSETLDKSVEEFNRHEGRGDGEAAVLWLDRGLTMLRTSLYLRMHQDVERVIGRDSMLMPVSELRTMILANQTIEAYQIAESAAAARHFRYVADAEIWYLDWLARLRLGEKDWRGEIVERTKTLFAQTAEARRRAFSDEMAHVLHESLDAPLVLFQLLPPAVRIVTAQAFGDRKTAEELRSGQAAILPSINDCRQCRGQVLEGGEQCPKCGNPLWTYEWLTAAD